MYREKKRIKDVDQVSGIIMKSFDPFISAKKTFIRKKLGHTAVSAIKASSVTL